MFGRNSFILFKSKLFSKAVSEIEPLPGSAVSGAI
jgi:hypothetical protein